MSRLKHIVRVCLIGAIQLLHASAVSAQDTRDRPIENFISPAQLFPSEGGLRAPYAPLPAFDRVEGKVIGHITATLTSCPPTDGAPECGVAQAWHIVLNGGRPVDLYTDEVSYEQGALVSYQPAVLTKDAAWSKVEFEGGSVWIRSKIKEVVNFETRASAIHEFDTWCTSPGVCKPIDAAMRKELERMMAGEFKLQACGERTYQIQQLVKRAGGRYYKVTLTDVVEGTPRPKLPQEGYIPTRRKDGTHVGLFWSRGC